MCVNTAQYTITQISLIYTCMAFVILKSHMKFTMCNSNFMGKLPDRLTF